MNQFPNLLNGEISRAGSSFEVISPVHQKIIGEGLLLSKREVGQVFQKSSIKDGMGLRLKDLDKLARYLKQKKEEFVKQIILETGYITRDARDLVDGSIELVTYFATYIHDTSVVQPISKFSYASPVARKLRLVYKPYGVIAAMTSQNAPLILELTIILNALAAGNSVILRPSSRCVGTAALLMEGLLESLPRDVVEHISIISCKATDFLNFAYQKSNLIHYIGSTHHGRGILNESLSQNIKSLVDGEGNSMVVIDDTASLDDAVKACRDGIIRCNGELCSTVRTIVVDFKIYEDFVSRLKALLRSVNVGNPFTNAADMGPLFDESQVKKLYEVSKKYSIISDKTRLHGLGGNYTTPFLCQLDSGDAGFLQEQVYGPIAGVVAYKGDGWKKWLIQSPYKLNDAVFSNDEHFVDEFIATSLSQRIIINHDPSIESVFEPWGGFLPNGSNEVSFWINKYRKIIQLDTKL